ncbi:tripartite tricarboxylate transporter substrate binding protein [Pararoseomonas sp. SCSIO 73927]|uniref:Bug family tripartite tricarboxylate transporter substrate binding protein n=1 Tax=Pararoseomonas sp. SCSIO 73927 TaxID=3114537 RepID=UPI0030CD835E
MSKTGTGLGVLSRRLVLGAPALLLPRQAGAQSPWPAGPIRFITPASPGGSTDVMVRLLSEGLSRRYQVPFPVDTRPGAEGSIAAQAFVQAAPGTALFFTNAGTVTTTPVLIPRLPYDPWSDLVTVAPVATDFLAYAVRPDFPAATLPEVFERMRARPGTYTWCSAPGGTNLLTNAYLQVNKLDAVFINYRTTGAAALDTAAGRVDLAVQPLITLAPLVQEGKLRLLAVTPSVRSPAWPDVPTAKEAGLPELQLDPVSGAFGWKGMPGGLRSQLTAAVQDIVRDPGTVQRMRSLGLVPRIASAQEYERDLRETGVRLAELAQKYGVRSD